MSNLLKVLQDEMKVCMLAGKKERLSVVKMLIAEIKNVQINTIGGRDKEWIDAELVPIISSYHKTMVKSMAEFPADRQEILKQEIKIIEEFLPRQLTVEELKQLVTTELQSLNERNFGILMKLMQTKFAGKTDGKTLSETLKQVLAEIK